MNHRAHVKRKYQNVKLLCLAFQNLATFNFVFYILHYFSFICLSFTRSMQCLYGTPEDYILRTVVQRSYFFSVSDTGGGYRHRGYYTDTFCEIRAFPHFAQNNARASRHEGNRAGNESASRKT